MRSRPIFVPFRLDLVKNFDFGSSSYSEHFPIYRIFKNPHFFKFFNDKKVKIKLVLYWTVNQVLPALKLFSYRY
jgi:hypothetical protein